MRRFTQDKGRTGKLQVWEITCVKNTIQMMWGQQGGAMQETTQDFEAVNVGKSNEKSPEEVAQEAADREIKKKTRQGYREVNIKTGVYLEEASSSEIDFVELPQNLRFLKPQNSINAHCEKLAVTGGAFLARKRDGMMHVVTVDDDGEPRMYSSNMLINHKDEQTIPWLDRYPHLYDELSKFPPRTILLGELVAHYDSDATGIYKDDFIYVGSVVKSLTPRALELQNGEKGKLGYCIWDIAFWEGRCIIKEDPAYQRFARLESFLLEQAFKWITMPELVTLNPTDAELKVEILGKPALSLVMDDPDNPLHDALEFAKGMGWEGYVIVDASAKYGDKAFSFHGKAERPKEVCKLKPKFEADFVVYWDPKKGKGTKGKGKKSGGVGSVQAYLWDPKKSELVSICLVGGGLSDENVKKFADPKLYPQIWQVEFAEWTEKGALRFPEFVRVRDDKCTEECTTDQMPEELRP